MGRSLPSPLEHGVGINLKHASQRTDTQPFGLGGYDAYNQLSRERFTIEDGTTGFEKVRPTHDTLFLPSRFAPSILRLGVGPPPQPDHAQPQAENQLAWPVSVLCEVLGAGAASCMPTTSVRLRPGSAAKRSAGLSVSRRYQQRQSTVMAGVAWPNTSRTKEMQ